MEQPGDHHQDSRSEEPETVAKVVRVQIYPS